MEIAFQPVLYAMVETNLKLIVSLGAFRESMVLNYIDIQFDAQMDPENLTSEKSESDKAFWSRFNSTPPPLNLRNRLAFESVTKIHFVQQTDGRNLNLLVTDSGDGFARDISLMRRYCGDAIAGQEYRVLYESLRAALHCPQLDRDAANTTKGQVTNIVLYLVRSLSRELTRNLHLPIDTSSNPFILFAERPVR